MRLKLTKRSLESITAPPNRVFVYDTELSGFGVTILPSGGRSFFVQYRTPGGRRGSSKRLKLGSFGALTVDEARALAKKQLALVAQGGDPSVSRAADKTAPTVAELGEDFLAFVAARRKARTAHEYGRMWARHIVPHLGGLKVHLVSLAQVELLHRKLSDTPYQANRVLALLGAFFSYSEKRSLRMPHSNPAAEVEPYREHARERYLTPVEVQRLGEALARAEQGGICVAPNRRRSPAVGSTAKHRPSSADQPKTFNSYALAVIRLLVLTGMREGEALALRWSEVDLDRGVLRLSDTKTGRSVRHIGAPATELLASLPRRAGSPFVFPGRTPDQHLVEINRVWYAVRAAADLSDVRLHDLRHSFASAAAGAGGSLLMIASLLGHKNTATTKRYAHLAADPLRAAANDTSRILAQQLQSRAGSDVASGAGPLLLLRTSSSA